MAKTNFTKAEEALANALQKMNIDKIYDETKPAPDALLKENLKKLSLIKRHIKKLHKDDPEIFKKLNIEKKKILLWIEHPADIQPEGWVEVDLVLAAIENYIKSKESTQETDEKVIEEERQKHINKRFNVNDKWLPLQ